MPPIANDPPNGGRFASTPYCCWLIYSASLLVCNCCSSRLTKLRTGRLTYVPDPTGSAPQPTLPALLARWPRSVLPAAQRLQSAGRADSSGPSRRTPQCSLEPPGVYACAVVRSVFKVLI